MNYKAIFIALSCISFYAAAVSDNTVQFQGEVNEETCSVTINGNDATPVILLPSATAGELKTAGSTSSDTTFTVGVTGCSTNAATLKTRFAGNNVTAAGNLGNTGTATNVSIQLLDADGSTPLSFTDGETVSTSSFTKAEGSSSATQTLTARYYAEAADVTPGSVVASAQYAISYQ